MYIHSGERSLNTAKRWPRVVRASGDVRLARRAPHLNTGLTVHCHFLFSHLHHQRPCLRDFFEIMDNIALLTRRPSSLPHNFQTFSFKLGL